MGKKVLGLCAALLLAGSPAAFAAVSVGAQGGCTAGPEWECGATAGINFKNAAIPLVIVLTGGIYPDRYELGIASDWWLANPRLGELHWYFGPGSAFSVGIGKEGGERLHDFFAGARFVVGTNAYLSDPLELYLQAAVELGVRYVRADSTVQFPALRVPVNLGFRVWF